MPINVSNTAAALNELSREFSPEYFEPLRAGLEFEGIPSNDVPGRTATTALAESRPVEDSYDRASILIGGVLQPYQSAFTPNLTVNVDSISTRLQRAKADIAITADDLDKFRNRWLQEWGNWTNQDPVRWSFAAWILQNRVIPQLLDDLTNAAWAGVAVTPTAGTAGTVLQSFTGYRARIADYITATVVTPIATGVIAAGDAFEKIETFVDGLPDLYRAKGGKILCSPTIQRWYWKRYRTLHGTGNSVSNNMNEGAFIDNTNIQLSAVKAMTGSQRLIYVPNMVDTLIYGTKIGEGLPVPQIRWESHERTLKGMMEIHRFYDFERPEHIFVNDQV